ncbi:hypothetical protein GOQ30_12835 [Flavobacterium sp. TP390]|uniref:TonB-dependent receptor n=1 Tax=Flavobacterium profundi TaxID=1774945 RepID=A0A6I4IT57_9FLAO|nr:hypothetical protein [Flavobacterium profundi]MVO10050.1 hypothetical protein [Flavobacterium profundi]
MCQGQTIKGKITSIDHFPLEAVTLIVKDSANAKGIKEFTIARNGSYEIALKKNYASIYIEASAVSYEKNGFLILNPEKNKTYIHDFVLEKDLSFNLKEVEVVAKKKPYQQLKDTVNFNVASYTDGSDRKIQDVIKKLPGMEVNDDTGEISYKGKPVETVQLDGDDLFSGNYTIGTKNINVDMIEQVQAIENFSSNKLLKGLEAGGKVALNLKLRKNITDISGSINSSLGAFQEKELATDSDFNFLTVSSKIKSFGTLSFNNVAINYTPFNYFGSSMTRNESNLRKFKNYKIIPEFNFLNTLDNKRTVLNNSIFGNYNISFKQSTKTNLKSNIYWVKDAISSLTSNETNNTINNQSFTTSDNSASNKKPNLLRADFEMKHFLSNVSSIDYNFLVSNEKITSSSTLLQNNTQRFDTHLLSEDFFLKSAFLYTQRLSNKQAFQLSSNQTFDNLNQDFLIYPNNNLGSSLNTNQINQSKKITFDLHNSIIGKLSRIKYRTDVGMAFNTNLMTTNWFDNNQSALNISKNDINYTQSKLFFENDLDYDWGNWKIFSSLNFTFLNQYLKDFENQNKKRSDDFIIEPSINFIYKINRITNLSLGLGSKTSIISDKHLLSNSILISNRTSTSNQPDFNLQKTSNYSINYNIYDLSRQFQLNFGVNYNENFGNFFSDITINQNASQIQYFFLNEKYSSKGVNFLFEKYIHFIESTLRFKTYYGISNYKNFINSSNIRNNESDYCFSEVYAKTAFDGKFNFQNILKYNYTKNKSNNSNGFSNTQYNNSFKILCKLNKKWFADVAYDFYATGKNTEYNFIDFFVKFIPNDKRFIFSLTGKNLLNNENFLEINTSDYYTSVYSSNIIPRTFLITCNYSF